MKNLQIIVSTVIIIAGWTTVSAAQNEPGLEISEREGPTATELLKWREVLTYEIRYSFFKLGQARIELTDTLYNGKKAWHLRGIITSAPAIPFVGREENHYNSLFEVTNGRARELVYWKDDVDEEEFNEDRYVYDYEQKQVYAFKRGEPKDTLDLEEPATSGPLIYFYSRMIAGRETDSRVFIYLDERKGTIDMEYTRRLENRSYKAFEQPVSAFFASGVADINGPFGFSGDFKAWFADDALRIPLEAHVKVWLGNVKVRLMDYNKELRNEKNSF